MLSLMTKRTASDELPCSMPMHIPLASAYLCQDCNCVSNCSRTCPACASEVLMSLSCILNREEPEPIPATSYTYVTALVA
jgi:hypothetical protein